uniref:Importin N-terminal domain-containing protein n=1 Tax=Macrostomum lignano TaxID=282301 RepID=A0A1I8FZR5_9PLAT
MEVEQVELLCKQLYETQDASLRSEAEKALVNLTNDPLCMSKCQLLLERANSPYSQLVASNSLTKLLSKPSLSLSVEERLEMRNYVLRYLAQHSGKLVSYVQQSLAQLFCRLTRLGWFDSDSKEDWPFRNVVQLITNFLQRPDSQHVLIGVQLLSQLVAEMNTFADQESSRSLSMHRKIASSFRDSQLFEIFRLGCSLLRDASSNLKSLSSSVADPSSTEHNLLAHTLRLVKNCLNFDFIGTAGDESADDLSTVQIPTSWRPAFFDQDCVLPGLFFELFSGLPASLAPLSLACLVQVASIRRSLFSNAERAAFLNSLVRGVRDILRNPVGLNDPSCYHEFCRLVARLKSNYQLGELVRIEAYDEFIKLIADFTVRSLQLYNFGSNSVHYLLSLWQRMVASIPYLKVTEPHYLEAYVPEIVTAYVTSRVDSVSLVFREGLEQPLDDVNLVSQQLEQLATIGRCEYEKTVQLLVQLFDQSASAYSQVMPLGGTDVLVQECKLAWLTYFMGACVGGRISFNSTDVHDELDSELCCRVLQLMRLADQRLPHAAHRLELAFLYFLDQFRKIYVGDSVQKACKVYRRMGEVLGIADESAILAVFVTKASVLLLFFLERLRGVIANLKFWSHHETIIGRTLALLSDLSAGYSAVRKLVRLESVQFVLANHSAAHFPFLSGQETLPTRLKFRTSFYAALGRLLMVDLGEDEDRFQAFMQPLTDAFSNVGNLLNSNQLQEAQTGLVGLARDLRGIAFSLNTKTAYMMLLDWFCPDYSQLMVKALEVWGASPEVTTPILKLYAEVAQNRSNRLQFDVASPDGVLLFRELSRVVCTYGEGLLARQPPKERIYHHKLKGIAVCFTILKASLSGNYVNLGVFSLYQDPALDSALSVFVRLLLSVEQTELLQYPKLSQAYYPLLDCLAQDHVYFLAGSEPTVFLYVLQSVHDGLTSSDTLVCSACCAVLDSLLSFLFTCLQRRGRLRPRQREAVQPRLLEQLLVTLLNIVVFEDCRHQWSLSRPLLPLILLNEKCFQEVRASIISSQQWGGGQAGMERQSAVSACFDKLMEGVERNLLVRNRDKFTQNLSLFRRDIGDALKAAPAVDLGNEMS